MTKKQTIVFDIETMESITKTAREYQINFINSLGGFKTGEMVLWTGGRQTGKSMYYTLLKNREYMKHEPKSKYQFSRNSWFTVSLGKMDWKKTTACIEWCEETFGPQPKNPDAWSRWQIKYSSIYFRDSKDYEWFMLRWS